MNQRHFGGNTFKPSSSSWFSENSVLAEKKLSNVRSVIILSSGKGVNSLNKSDAKYTSHDRLVAINWILIRFLQGHRKLKLLPCGEFQSRMNLVMGSILTFKFSFCSIKSCFSPRTVFLFWSFAFLYLKLCLAREFSFCHIRNVKSGRVCGVRADLRSLVIISCGCA